MRKRQNVCPLYATYNKIGAIRSMVIIEHVLCSRREKRKKHEKESLLGIFFGKTPQDKGSEGGMENQNFFRFFSDIPLRYHVPIRTELVPSPYIAPCVFRFISQPFVRAALLLSTMRCPCCVVGYI